MPLPEERKAELVGIIRRMEADGVPPEKIRAAAARYAERFAGQPATAPAEPPSALEQFGDFYLGRAKEAGNTLVGLGEGVNYVGNAAANMVRSGLQQPQIPRDEAAFDSARAMLAPEGEAQEMGASAERMGEMALIPGAGGALAKAGSGVARAAQMASSPVGMGVIAAGQSLARGKGPVDAAIAGIEGAVVGKGIGGVIGRVGKVLANPALNARLAHLIRKKAPEAAAKLVTPPAMSSSGAAPAAMPAAVDAAEGAAAGQFSMPVRPSTGSAGVMSAPAPPTAPVPAAPAVAPAVAAAESAAPAAAKAAANPAITAPGGWREVGITNWYGTKDGPTAAEWARMGGAKANRAWLESRNLIPGSNTAQDVATAVARGVPEEQIVKLYGTPKMAADRGVGATTAAAAKTEKAAAKASSAAEAKIQKIRDARATMNDPLTSRQAKAAAQKVLRDPQAQALAMAEEVQAKVVGLKAQGLSAEQIAASLRDTHGLPEGPALQMVQMIFAAGG